MEQHLQGSPGAMERLSEMVDGEADAASTAQLCRAWSDDAQLRGAWHAWHLIGDVLRSDDLAVPSGRDAEFLQRLRTRLAAEPVVLAPRSDANASPPAARRWHVRRWSGPIAVAAGFVAVAGALLVMRSPQTQSGPALASASSAADVRSVVALPALAADSAAEPQTVAPNDRVIRDARLDRYLAAHKQFGGSSALGVPSGFLRSATAEVPDR